MSNKTNLKPHTIKDKLVPHFKASVQSDGVLEMLVYDQIGESFDGSGVTAKAMKAQLDDTTGYDRVSIRINSPGGDCFEGVAIGNLLKACGKPVNVFIDGVAASSASIIAMAGDNITMASNALMMIHNAWSVAVGEAKDMRKMADTLDTVSSAIAQTYVDKTGQTMADVQAMMDAETWFSGTDAVSKGFATSVAKESAGGAANALARGFKGLKAFKNVPAELKNDDDMNDEAGCECTCEQCESGDCSACSNPDCTDAACVDCPNQTAGPEDSNLSLFIARLRLVQLGLSSLGNVPTA